MKIKNIVFDSCLRGKGISITGAEEDEVNNYINRFNDIKLCERFGWTEQEVLDLSFSFYNDAILILNKENQINNSKK